MKFLLPMTLSLLALAASGLPLTVRAQGVPNGGGDKPLGAYRDKNRVLLVFAPTPQDEAYQQQIKLWQGEKAGFEDRQLVVVPFFANTKNPSPKTLDPLLPFIHKYRNDPGEFTVVLIGKDGHDAYHAAKPVPATTLYGIIDAMPMRRVEMKHAAPSTPTPSPTPRRPDLNHDE